MKPMTPGEKFVMIRTMQTYGDNFTVALAECMTLADERNFLKLCNAFPEYVDKYTKIARGEMVQR